MYLKIGVPVIFLPVMQIRQKPKKSLAGKRSTGSVRCVRIPGDGRRIIRMDTRNKMGRGVAKWPAAYLAAPSFLPPLGKRRTIVRSLSSESASRMRRFPGYALPSGSTSAQPDLCRERKALSLSKNHALPVPHSERCSPGWWI